MRFLIVVKKYLYTYKKGLKANKRKKEILFNYVYLCDVLYIIDILRGKTLEERLSTGYFCFPFITILFDVIPTSNPCSYHTGFVEEKTTS